MNELTKEQCIALAETEWWKDLSHEEIVRFQLFHKKLCMPFSVFHESVEKVLDRPVWTHEFAFYDRLVKEYLGESGKPSMQDIIELIPEDKRVIVYES